MVDSPIYEAASLEDPAPEEEKPSPKEISIPPPPSEKPFDEKVSLSFSFFDVLLNHY